MKTEINMQCKIMLLNVTAVVSFFKINDVLLNKNKITKFMSEQKIR
jgi:hypothetical protein